MAYIGQSPSIGNFQVCDAISVVNGQAAYTMQVSSVNVVPETANHMIVSLNGIIQAPGSSYTVAGSTITFASNLVTGDVINFIHILGSVLDLGVPSDSTVSLAKLTATGTKNSTTFLRGDNTFAAPSGGKVLQFSQTLNAYTYNMTSTSLTDVLSASGTTMEIAMTPSATSSKLLFSGNAFFNANSTNQQENRFEIVLLAKIASGSYSAIEAYTYLGQYNYIGASALIINSVAIPFSFLYTSNTTSAVTFKLQTKVYNGSSSININNDGKPSQFNIMEIGA